MMILKLNREGEKVEEASGTRRMCVNESVANMKERVRCIFNEQNFTIKHIRVYLRQMCS